MKPSLENTRRLGVGETVLDTDFSYIKEDQGDCYKHLLDLVDEPEVGCIIDGTEPIEYRRYTVQHPVDAMIEELGLETEIAKKAFREFLPCIQLLDRKQKQYGMGNVEWLGEYGVNLRVGEKAARIKWLLNQKYNPTAESILDSWMDNVNLSLIGFMLHKKLWK